jgi:hypothetical protein
MMYITNPNNKRRTMTAKILVRISGKREKKVMNVRQQTAMARRADLGILRVHILPPVLDPEFQYKISQSQK